MTSLLLKQHLKNLNSVLSISKIKGARAYKACKKRTLEIFSVGLLVEHNSSEIGHSGSGISGAHVWLTKLNRKI